MREERLCRSGYHPIGMNGNSNSSCWSAASIDTRFVALRARVRLFHFPLPLHWSQWGSRCIPVEGGFSPRWCPMGSERCSNSSSWSAGSVGAGTIVLRQRLRLFRESKFEPATGLLSAEVPVRGSTLPLWIPSDWKGWQFELFVLECCIDRQRIRGPESNGSRLLFSTPFALESMAQQVPACRARFLPSMVPDGK